MEKKISPYRIFTEWLLNPCPDAELSGDVIKAINPRTVICMFGKIGGLTIFLNDHFNNFSVMNLDPLEFYQFLKSLVKKYKIKKWDFSYFPTMKRDKTISEIQMKLPHLKKSEIIYLLEQCKSDEDYDSFCESLGIRKNPKIKKIKKKGKKNKKLIVSTFGDSMIKNIRTMDDWIDCFGM